MLKVSDFFGELKLRRDSQVADFGCGVGENSKILSELVVDGKVFAVDVHKDLLEHLETDILKEKKKQEKVNTQGQGLGLDAMQDVHDAAILQPDFVVQKAPQLLRELRHGGLRLLTRLQPIVVNALEAQVRHQGGHGRQLQHMGE